jgi:HEPN domain-containing protein
MSIPEANVLHSDLCATQGRWTEVLRDAEELTPFAITARYPGEDEEVTSVAAVRALDLAERVRTAVREVIRKMGITLAAEPLP